MKFLCLVYQKEADVEALSDHEHTAIVDDVRKSLAELETSGHYIAASPLHPVRTARTVRNRDGKVSVTDGPFAETKEQLGGFYLIEAEDLDEAVRLASTMPPARLGCIEVRALRDLDLHPRNA